MTEQQAITELTTRDVFLQVDRRLTHIEGDLRSLSEKGDDIYTRLDNKIDGLRSEMSTRLSDEIGGLRGEMNAQIGGLRSEMSTRFDRVNTRSDEIYTKLDGKIDSKFYQLVGILLVTWISTIVVVLFKS